MRTILASFLVAGAVAGCASSTPEGQPEYASMKARLAEPTRLYIGPGESTGAITAERYTHDGWVSGTTPLTIAHGEIDGVVGPGGQLALSQFEVDVDSIAIPDSVFGKPAELRDVRVKLAVPAFADVVWTDDNNAEATLTLALDLEWTIAINNTSTQLGTQHLPPVVVHAQLSGDGQTVTATASLDAQGTLWNWADLLKLTELKLDLSATTVDEM
jgi:hypothetical protein